MERGIIWDLARDFVDIIDWFSSISFYLFIENKLSPLLLLLLKEIMLPLDFPNSLMSVVKGIFAMVALCLHKLLLFIFLTKLRNLSALLFSLSYLWFLEKKDFIERLSSCYKDYCREADKFTISLIVYLFTLLFIIVLNWVNESEWPVPCWFFIFLKLIYFLTLFSIKYSSYYISSNQYFNLYNQITLSK